jgi:hypothetical protein
MPSFRALLSKISSSNPEAAATLPVKKNPTKKTEFSPRSFQNFASLQYRINNLNMASEGDPPIHRPTKQTGCARVAVRWCRRGN